MVAQRPTFHSDIGVFLVHLRLMKGWSQRKTVTVARQRGIALSLGSLRFLEEGKTKYPDRELLAGIAALYDVPFELLVQRFVEANYGVEVRMRALEAGPSPEGEVFDPTLARLIHLEARVAEYESMIRELRNIVDRAGLTTPAPDKEESS